MNYLEKNFENYKKDLSGLIKYKTVLEDVWPNQEMKNALLYMKSLADRDGMRSFIHPEGYYGYIEIGSGEEMIGLLAHIDVVPTGDVNLWDTDPFDLIEKDGRLIARGTQDDKGPLMLMYYLMKEILETGRKLDKRIRLIFPTDEESFWRGIEKYKELEEHPTYGITPDAMFPATFIERESMVLQIKNKGSNEFIIKGGMATNAIPEHASLTINGEVKNYKGISCHAMDPTNGDNAITKLTQDLDSSHPMIQFIKNEIKREVNGETLFNNIYKDEYAQLALTLGKISIDKNESMITIDMRLPTNVTSDVIQEKVTNKLSNYGEFEIKRIKHHDPLIWDIDSEFIKTLSMSFNEVMGTNEMPMTTGGGTYARALDNIVAFGPLFKDELFTEHEVNESLSISNFIKAYNIYNNLFDKWLK